jgi:putative tryptophan/tyrosine transport system substrate-binding protein
VSNRREFLTLLGGAAAAWPLAARAQQAMPVVGYLNEGAPEPGTYFLAEFRKGLGDAGYFEGRNVAIEYRWAYNQDERLPELAADLIRRSVNVIVTPGSGAAARTAKTATTTIPIVFGIVADPVQTGLVASLNRPGGNATGISYMSTDIAPKRLGLLHELKPHTTHFAMLVNPRGDGAERLTKELKEAASAAGWEMEVLTATTIPDIDMAFEALVQKQADALLVNPDILFGNRRVQLATLAARYAVPTMYPDRQYTEVGGLMSYGTRLLDQYRQLGIYTARVLKGEKPAELPVMQPTKFEFVINFQTAKALGLTVPPTLLARADEVIE